MLKVAVLVSGGGSNLQSILDYEQDSFKVEMVIGSKDGIYGLERAKNAGVPSYLSILDGEILKVFKDRIVNIHPSLIPSFCGDKMYGMHVHNAVRASGVRFTGCTVHFVNEEVDGGAIILQEAVPVYFEDTAEDIQKRVLVEEHKMLPRAIDLISRGKVEIIDGRVNILK